MTKFVLGLLGLIGIAVGTGAYFFTKKKKKSTKAVKARVFNTIDFDKCRHYNPFSYISENNCEKDILRFVEVLINNTSSKQPSDDDFRVRAEKLLYTAYIALMFVMNPEEDHNFETLIEMINFSECHEDDESFKNAIDMEFEFLEYWIDFTGMPEKDDVMKEYAKINEPGKGFDEYYEQVLNEYYRNRMPKFEELDKSFQDSFYCELSYLWNDPNYLPTPEQIRIGTFAIKQYKAYKLAVGKSAGSIVGFCRERLSPFALDDQIGSE